MSDSTNDQFTVPSDDPTPYYTDEYYDEFDEDYWDSQDGYDEDFDYTDTPEMTLLEYMQFEKIPGWLIAIVSFYLRAKSAAHRKHSPMGAISRVLKMDEKRQELRESG